MSTERASEDFIPAGWPMAGRRAVLWDDGERVACANLRCCSWATVQVTEDRALCDSCAEREQEDAEAQATIEAGNNPFAGAV